MRYQTKKKLVKFSQAWKPRIDILGMVLVCLYSCSLLPISILTQLPPTGGDMGSHFWPLVTLTKYGIPQGTFRVWNPGNLAGEPHLVHYFPLPFLLMALLAQVCSLGFAFKIVTIIPLFALPISIFWCVRWLGYRFPAPLISASLSLLFLFNESFSMWGGNALSLMAGQFAHGYALALLFLGIGIFGREISKQRSPLLSAFIFACILISHAYVALGVPLFVISFIFFSEQQSIYQRLRHATLAAIGTILLSIWFVFPMVDNLKWNTPFSMTWYSESLISEILPPILYPVVALFLIAPIHAAFTSKRHNSKASRYAILFWGLPCLGFAALYFVFPALGLVDVRAIPQIQIACTVVAALILSNLIRSFGRVTELILILPLTIVIIGWTDTHVSQFPNWAKWNYEGWQAKMLYDDLSALSKNIYGDFSQPRVVYEHNLKNRGAGTERVFEMLPYFANRATLESVYMQATILSPATFFIQALVSKSPSCALGSGYACPRWDLTRAEKYLRLLAVGTLILVTEELKNQARQSDYLKERNTFGPWSLYDLREPPNYVEILEQPVTLIDQHNWKNQFYDWFKDYEPSKPFLAINQSQIPLKAYIEDPQKWSKTNCHPSIKVSFNRLALNTDCPNRAHLLKFSYHPSWKSSSGDTIYLVSPGMMMLFPKQHQTVLDFGQKTSWQIATWTSLFAHLILVTLLVHSSFWHLAGRHLLS